MTFIKLIVINKFVCLVLTVFSVISLCQAQSYDRAGKVEILPETPGEHWVWVGNPREGFGLIDAGNNTYLGKIDTAGNGGRPLSSPDGREYYFPSVYYARGTYGERTTVLSVYNARTLAVEEDIVIPSKMHGALTPYGANDLTDDGRFLAVFNITPATSISIIDLEKRRFAGEIETPGCSLVYGISDRQFMMICANGSFQTITLDDDGNELSRERTDIIFDPEVDPVTEKPVRYGNQLLFVSYAGLVYPVDISRSTPRFGNTWSLFDDPDQQQQWQIAGVQHQAIHAQTGRVYALMHLTGPDSQPDPNARGGQAIWIFDVRKQERIATFQVPHHAPSAAREALMLEKGSFFGDMVEQYGMQELPNLGANNIQLTQGDNPLLLVATIKPSGVSVLDPETGAFLYQLDGVKGNNILLP